MGNDFDYNEQQGSGSKDLGAPGHPTTHRDVGDHTAKPDSGALAAFGGLGAAIKIQRAHVVSGERIDKPGYAMAGEGSGPGSHAEHGQMVPGYFKEEDPNDCG